MVAVVVTSLISIYGYHLLLFQDACHQCVRNNANMLHGLCLLTMIRLRFFGALPF